MKLPGSISGSPKRIVALVILLAIAVVAARKARGLYRAYREFRAVEARLPDLPKVSAVAHQRRAGFPTKIWVHRVNSVERAVLMAKEYRGMEMDVVYDSAAGYYDVGHPPTPSLGISLDHMFASVPDVGSHYFWIDFKNLDDANKDAACALLVSIGRKYGIVSRMIVESTNPRALSCFTEHGFYTSYYLFASSNLRRMSPAQVRDYYEEVKSNLLASKVTALSSDYRSLPFIEKYFPEMDILLWYLEDGRPLRFYATLAYLTQKDHVKVVLVSRSSPGYR